MLEPLAELSLLEEHAREAGEIAAQECQPIDAQRGSAVYRRLVRGLWPDAETG